MTKWLVLLTAVFVLPGCGEGTTTGPRLMDDVLTLSVTSATLTPGESLEIRASATAQVAWQSSDPSVAAVSGTGVVAALREGQAEITAISSGKKARATVKVTAPTATSTPTPVPTPTPEAGSSLIYGHDFNDGTLGRFVQWGGYTPQPVSVVADPTGSGRGSVARVVYERDPAAGGPVDVNGGLYMRPNPAGGHPDGVGFGDSIYFRGDLWIPRYPGARPLRPQHDQRKLLYLKFGDPGRRSSGIFLVAWGRVDGSGMDLWLVNEHNVSNLAIPVYGVGSLSWDTWHRIELQVVANRRGAADGALRLWIDGRATHLGEGVALFEPSESASSDFISEWGIGNQEQWGPDETVAMKDYRLWDSLEFRTGRP
ncbi:MAG TPA: Ig-like domain-containing protein [Longimicrobiaceae bacterium]|nr:Ig-like domain-containing protein [Longimicrobiaceae bacterium]